MLTWAECKVFDAAAQIAAFRCEFPILTSRQRLWREGLREEMIVQLSTGLHCAVAALSFKISEYSQWGSTWVTSRVVAYQVRSTSQSL